MGLHTQRRRELTQPHPKRPPVLQSSASSFVDDVAVATREG
jgi:hypothetical protein